MDGPRFDGITRLLATGTDRRRLATGLALALGGINLAQPVLAGCKKVGKTCDSAKDCCDGARCKNGKCKCKNGYKECQGKCYDLDKDEKHCGSCNTRCGADEKCRGGTCQQTDGDSGGGGGGGSPRCDPPCRAGERCVLGTCTPIAGGQTCAPNADTCAAGERISCGASNQNCGCFQTTERRTVCAAVDGAGFCSQCESSADCVEALGRDDASCIKGGNCCSGDVPPNFCALPCGEAEPEVR